MQAWKMTSVDTESQYLPVMRATRPAQLLILRLGGRARHSVGQDAVGRIYVHAQAFYAPDLVVDDRALGRELAARCRTY